MENTERNQGFFNFKDDQDTERDSQEESQIPKQEEEANVQNFQQKNINVQGGVVDEEQGSQANKKVEDKVEGGVAQLEEKPKKKKSLAKTFWSVFLTIVLSLIWNAGILYPMLAIVGVLSAFISIFKICSGTYNWKADLLNKILTVIFSISIVFVVFSTINGLFKSDYKEDVYVLWFVDCFFLFLSHIMIFSIIQMTKNDDFDLKCSKICTLSEDQRDVLVVSSTDFKCDLIMDIPLGDDEWTAEYQRILGETLEVEITSQRFNTFANHINHPTVLQYIGYQLIKGQNQKLRPHMGQFISLQVIALLKIVCCIAYIIYHFKVFTIKDAINIGCITLFTTNEIYCLSSMLSNYDLRRKTLMCQNLNKALVIAGKNAQYDKAVDIANNQSIETWDNSRRIIYEFFQETQWKLERSYICLLIYYLFVTNIILAAYGEIYIVISKDSILLQPLAIISSTFTFVLLNTIIFFRLYFGSQYNETFEEVQDSVENLIGIYQDMIQMYDYNFNEKGMTKQDYLNILKEEESEQEEQGQSQQQEGQLEKSKEVNQNDSRYRDEQLQASQLQEDVRYYNCYDILASKFMYLSDYYITKGQQFQGKVYSKQEEQNLQFAMMSNCLKSLKRIKNQIQVDSKLQCYKAFNIAKLDFKDTLFTICLGLLTLLPSIITKFIEQFQTIEQGKAQ